MPDVPFPRPAHRIACLASVLVLAACSGAGDPPPPTAAATSSAAPSRPVLQCMPSAPVPLHLPIEEGLALDHDDLGTPAAAIDCALSLFGDAPLKTPLGFDLAYARVFRFHEEDGTLAPAAIPRANAQLFRLGDAGDADTWLLRLDTGVELEGSRYDVLFSTDRDSGELVDQLLVGARGLMYRRDYDIDGATAFAIREETGRAALAGPSYLARYEVRPDGRFAKLSSQVEPAAATLHGGDAQPPDGDPAPGQADGPRRP